MPLTVQLANDFESAVQQRGAAYFRAGRVVVKSSSAVSLVAKVRGTIPYRVELRREGRHMVASCTCPYFETDACKHVWAAILAADQQRLLQGDLRDLQASVEYGGLRLTLGESGDTDASEYLDEDLKSSGRYADDLGVLDDEEFEAEDESEGEADVDGGEEGAREDGSRSNAGFGKSPSRDGIVASRGSDPLRARLAAKPAIPTWRDHLAELRQPAPAAVSGPFKREVLYVIDAGGAQAGSFCYLEILMREMRKNDRWSRPRPQSLRADTLQRLHDDTDRRILSLLTGAREVYAYGADDGTKYFSAEADYGGSQRSRLRLSNEQARWMLPEICRTGRCRVRLREGDEEPQWLPVQWDDVEGWQFQLEMRLVAPERYELTGVLYNAQARMALSEPALLTDAGFAFTRDRVFRYEHHGAFRWIALLRSNGPVAVPAAQSDEFLTELLSRPYLPPLQLAEELRYEEVSVMPLPRLAVKPDASQRKYEQLCGALSFDYGGQIVALDDPRRGIVQPAQRRVWVRDFAAEQAASERLSELGCRRAPPRREVEYHVIFAASRLSSMVKTLASQGWRIEAEGKIYRSAGELNLSVSSGVDWFELHGDVDFGEVTATLPDLLAALRRGEGMIRLDDGSFGLLPQQWLQQYGLLAALGKTQGGHVRFARSQALLLDVLVASRPETHCDELFARVRDELRGFSGITAVDQPACFEGELRPYQKEGLGWFDFLRRFGFGGCLADDMGLGKTVQILAMLESRRELRERAAAVGDARILEPAVIIGDATTGISAASPTSLIPRPSLVVMPRSLIFNWKQEAERFAPRLRVLDHTGILRLKDNDQFQDYDLVLTTYGTLRNDAVHLKDVHFDYVILDESQAIKNADSASAKAARLLNGDHRLALSGTPIENHLGELWSLFEFLNPGMLGAASVFKMSQGALRNPDEETRKLLAQALRPFLLRRTKEQVVRELPAKVEQTLYCELDSKQRKLYDELRDHYRATLLTRVQKEGVAKAKIQILEALLRLRQAAIHPGLLDDDRKHEPSAKLDMLLPMLLQVIEEGHKILVFSQFTGMLAIVRTHLDRDGIAYEYLDGQTRDRQTCVERFQTDPRCQLFLISLKAGGVGLNLTAAQYVFLLDPWWNPAVEAQAIDRAHRIGQVNQVFAYRLIARGTVEEKVLELQNTKRELADAIIGAGDGVIKNLGKAELELLLS